MSSRDHPDWWEPMGGQNSQDSILERRSLVWNDNDIEDGEAPPAFYSGTPYVGKFFPRGCRGMIEQIQIYCRDAGVDRITLRYSPHPCLGPLGEVTITPLAGWSWVSADVEEMWNYDSLFIWVLECVAGADHAYDTVEPYDGHVSGDTGVTWADLARRPFIRVVYAGETPGDVPVSGTINVVEIPSVASESVPALPVNVPHNTWTTICYQEGAGTLLTAIIRFTTSAAPTAGALPASVSYGLALYVDGTLIILLDNRQATQSEIATFGRCAIGEFYQATVAEPAYDVTVLAARLPITFRRRALLMAYQTTGAAVSVTGTLYTNLIR